MEENECRETESTSLQPRRTSVLDRFFGMPFFDFEYYRYAPPVEVLENDNEFRVYVELPGVNEKDVTTTLSEGNLVIKGEKKSSTGEQENLCSCSERAYGSFERVVELASSVDSAKVKAHYNRGVLEVILPKKEETKPRIVKIETT